MTNSPFLDLNKLIRHFKAFRFIPFEVFKKGLGRFSIRFTAQKTNLGNANPYRLSNDEAP